MNIKKALKIPIIEYFYGRKFIFHHVPKCGGTTLKKILEVHFEFLKDYSYRGESRINIKKVFPFHLIVGHFELEKTHLILRYPEIINGNIITFTMIRDPFEFKVSLYYYWKKNKIGWFFADSLKDFILMSPNYLSNNLGCSAFNYQKVLSYYNFIGLVEYFDESLNKLSLVIKRKLIPLQILNSTVKNDEYNDLLADNEFMYKFRQNNELDYRIYRWVEDRFFNDKT